MSEQEEVNTFDIIVVGSGTSGLLLVHELATLCPHLKILVIERGKRYCDQLPCVRSSLDWGTASTLDSKSVDSPTIQFETAPHCDLYGRTIKCPVGNGVGGSSNINAMIWTAGRKLYFMSTVFPTVNFVTSWKVSSLFQVHFNHNVISI